MKKHRVFSPKDFKPGVAASATLPSPKCASNMFDDDIAEDAQLGSSTAAQNDLPDVIEHSIAAALLKLEHFCHVASKTIYDFFGRTLPLSRLSLKISC